MNFKTLEEHLESAKKLVETYGYFPQCTWLRKNGFQSLYQMSRLHPDKFAKFPLPPRKYRHLEDWVGIAKDLAKKNNGKLPTVSWLIENKLGMLCRQMQKNPEAFSLITQERNFRRPLEWVVVAEKLSDKHKGLPNTYWLQKQGYKALDKVMRQHSELFAHIPLKNKKEISNSK